MSRHRLVSIAGVVLVVWAVFQTQCAAALAISSLDPITIDACRLDNTRSYVSAFKPLSLIFTNRASMPVNEVRFTVTYAGRTEHIVDRGTFAQDVRIEHAFNGFYGVPHLQASPNCRVDYVEFSDGTVWMPSSTASSPCPPDVRPR
jgi:hypothetical protein